MTLRSCDRCGTDALEVNYSERLDAWVCVNCYSFGVELFAAVERGLGDEPKSRANIARAVGRDPKNGNVGRVLKRLGDLGLATHSEQGWRAASPQG